MKAHFFDLEDTSNPLNGSEVESIEAALRMLDRHQDRPAFFAELVCEHGGRLLVGIGGSFGCAQYSSANRKPPYLLAVSPGLAGQVTEFLAGGNATPIPARNCLPHDLVRELVRYFMAAGKPSPAVAWEEV